MKGVIVGQEWSPANDRSKKKSKTWLYTLDFGDGTYQIVTEEELTEWNK